MTEWNAHLHAANIAVALIEHRGSMLAKQLLDAGITIQFVKDRLLKFLLRSARVKDKKDASVAENALGGGDFLLGRLRQDVGLKGGEGRDDVELDTLDPARDATESIANRLICIPLGDGSHHLTVLHSAASQRKHCW